MIIFSKSYSLCFQQFSTINQNSCLVSVESSPDLPIPTRDDILVQRPRLDTGKNIFTQLTSVLNESCSSGPTALVASAARVKIKDGDVIVTHAVSPSDNFDAVRLIPVCLPIFIYHGYSFYKVESFVCRTKCDGPEDGGRWRRAAGLVRVASFPATLHRFERGREQRRLPRHFG